MVINVKRENKRIIREIRERENIVGSWVIVSLALPFFVIVIIVIVWQLAKKLLWSWVVYLQVF